MSAANPKNAHELSRLSIAHLLILMLICGISLALIAPAVHRVWQMSDDIFRGSKLVAISVPVLDHLYLGVELFGVAVLIHERLRSGPVKLSPGHWYFLAAAPAAVSLLASELIPIQWQAEWPIFYNLSKNALYLGAAIIGIWALYAIDSWPWRICLGMFTASLLTLSFVFVYRATEIAGFAKSTYRVHAISIWATLDIAVLVAALVAVGIDIARRNCRDWLHYFAVVAMLLKVLGIPGSFGPLIARWWRDLYFFIMG